MISQPLRSLSHHTWQISGADFSTSRLATTSWDKGVHVYSVPDGEDPVTTLSQWPRPQVSHNFTVRFLWKFGCVGSLEGEYDNVGARLSLTFPQYSRTPI
eukprot:sb/3478648/